MPFPATHSPETKARRWLTESVAIHLWNFHDKSESLESWAHASYQCVRSHENRTAWAWSDFHGPGRAPFRCRGAGHAGEVSQGWCSWEWTHRMAFSDKSFPTRGECFNHDGWSYMSTRQRYSTILPPAMVQVADIHHQWTLRNGDHPRQREWTSAHPEARSIQPVFLVGRRNVTSCCNISSYLRVCRQQFPMTHLSHVTHASPRSRWLWFSVRTLSTGLGWYWSKFL